MLVSTFIILRQLRPDTFQNTPNIYQYCLRIAGRFPSLRPIDFGAFRSFSSSSYFGTIVFHPPLLRRRQVQVDLFFAFYLKKVID